MKQATQQPGAGLRRLSWAGAELTSNRTGGPDRPAADTEPLSGFLDKPRHQLEPVAIDQHTWALVTHLDPKPPGKRRRPDASPRATDRPSDRRHVQQEMTAQQAKQDHDPRPSARATSLATPCGLRVLVRSPGGRRAVRKMHGRDGATTTRSTGWLIRMTLGDPSSARA
jgi:hypothetical protein